MAPPRSGGNRLWLVAVAVVGVLVLMGVGTTVAILVLRDDPGGGPIGGPPDPPIVTDPPVTDPPTTPPDTPAPPSGDEFNLRLDPTFGSQSASSGFTPDPLTVEITSGGQIDASYLDASGCRGYGAEAPDYRFRWESEGDLLRFFFLPDEDGEDTGLVVNAPDGSWHCNDDSFGTLNPTVEFASAASGQYDIWVTTYGSPGEFLPGTLNITELESQTPED